MRELPNSSYLRKRHVLAALFACPVILIVTVGIATFFDMNGDDGPAYYTLSAIAFLTIIGGWASLFISVASLAAKPLVRTLSPKQLAVIPTFILWREVFELADDDTAQ